MTAIAGTRDVTRMKMRELETQRDAVLAKERQVAEEALRQLLDEEGLQGYTPEGQIARQRGGVDWTRKQRTLQQEAQANDVKVAERMAKLVADEEASRVTVRYDPDDGSPLYRPQPRKTYCACHRNCPGFYGNPSIHSCGCGAS